MFARKLRHMGLKRGELEHIVPCRPALSERAIGERLWEPGALARNYPEKSRHVGGGRELADELSRQSAHQIDPGAKRAPYTSAGWCQSDANPSLIGVLIPNPSASGGERLPLRQRGGVEGLVGLAVNEVALGLKVV